MSESSNYPDAERIECLAFAYYRIEYVDAIPGRPKMRVVEIVDVEVHDRRLFGDCYGRDVADLEGEALLEWAQRECGEEVIL